MEACTTNIPRVHRGDLEFLSETEVVRMASMAKALSDPIRLQMLHLANQCEDLCTCEFEELLGLSQSRVSYHLNILLQSGFIIRENRGTWSHYRLNHPQLLDQVKRLTQEGPEQVSAIPA